jgi:hypothetical protein
VIAMRGPADDDGLLGDWLAHYAPLMLLIVVVVTVAAVAWATVTVPTTEVWSIIVDSEQKVPARQLGVVGEALFRARDTYGEAMATLHMQGPPDQLYRDVDLRVVPESRLLIVAAKTDDLYTSSVIADSMAQSLVHAFDRSGYPGLRILSAPQPAPVASTLPVPAVGLLGAVAGIVLAVAFATTSYRVRRPVLSLHRAVTLLDPDGVASIPGHARFLGALRRRPPGVSPTAARLAASRFAGERIALRAPGLREDARRRLGTILGITDDPGAEHVLVVADARTREREIADAETKGPASLDLLWIA